MVERDEIAAAYHLLRTQRLPFAACLSKQSGSLPAEMFEAVRQLAAVSLPLTIGLVMHLYLLCALRTFPLGLAWLKRYQRSTFLRRILNQRILIANVGGNRCGAGAPAQCQRRVSRTKEGYRLSGEAPFMSLATVADFAVVSAGLSDTEDGIFVVPLQPRPAGLSLSAPSFGNLMNASCTRRASMDDVLLPRDSLIYTADTSPHCQRLAVLQRAWLHFLTAAAYLGVTEEAIRRHCRDAAIDEPLEPAIELKRQVGKAVQASRLLAHLLTENQRSKCDLAQIEEMSCFAKYIATDTAAYCMGQLQDRAAPSLRPYILRTQSEVLLGAKHPPSNREIESRMLSLASA